MNFIRRIIGGVAIGVFAIAIAFPALADQPEDAWITTKIKMAFLTDEIIDGLDINVDTFDGRVTLHGQAASEAAKTHAEQRAKEIQGVQTVRNLIVVVPGAASKAVAISDEKLGERVSTVLSRDEALESSNIKVESVNDGVVVLSGDATTLSAHRRALEDARAVDGVRQVASEIQSPDELGDREIWQSADSSTLDNRAAGAMSDAWITTKAKLFLMTDPGLSPISINVDTYRGVVTLFGIVNNEEAKQRAGNKVTQISGVKAIRNELQVVADVAAESVERKDEELTAAVEKRLKKRNALGDADIEVEVKNRVVRLTGTVASQKDRMTALTTARATNGVNSVMDDLSLKRPES